ncbi:MAG: transcription termination/antitermination protein NusA, partial [Clostridia bacterium]|nr:transcription termination/antitermination protein NusA [Clostridia bacterium]
LENTKGIKKDFFIETLESALVAAYKKNFGEAKAVTVKLVPEKNTIKVIAYKTVVEEVVDPDTEISLAEAKEIKKTYKVGDTVQEEITPKEFGRIAAGTAKQVVTQKLREAERNAAFAELSDKVDTLMTGVVRREDNGTFFIELAGTNIEGVLMPSDQLPSERYDINTRIKVYVKKLRETARGVQAIVSRSSAGFVKKLFENEVPEIESGIVVIKNIVREAGYRTKIAITSVDPNVDALGACVGAKGVRVNSIVAELAGEKVDIVIWSDDPFEYIARALSPAKVVSVEIDEINKSSRVIVPDDKLSLAIGKSGQNVRLAAKLTGWKIDVKSETKAREEMEKAQRVPEETETVSLDDLDGLFSAVDLDDLSEEE